MQLAFVVLLCSSALAAVPSYGGYSLTWSDDFTGTGKTLPGPAWNIDTGTSYPGAPANWGTGEVEYYTQNTDNLCLTGDGNLQITPLRDASGKWTSGRIETGRDDFMAAPGKKMRVEGRIQMPVVSGAAALGYWPAFWTAGVTVRTQGAWPSGGEFDVMEDVNGLASVYGTMHCGVNPGGPCNEPTGLGSSTHAAPGWHVYRMDIDRSASPETMKFFIDGNQYNLVTETQVGSSTWASAVHQGSFILLNVAIGGGFPNSLADTSTPTASTEPGHPMLVDYVAVYNSW